MTLTADEHDQLRCLEESLWRAETRFDRDHMNEVLAPDFFELGRSGRVYGREDTSTLRPSRSTRRWLTSRCDQLHRMWPS